MAALPDMGMFDNIFGSKKNGGKPIRPEDLPDSKKIALQHQMILKLGAELAKTNKELAAMKTKLAKLNDNNSKAMPKIAELDRRLKAIEEKT